MQLEIFLVLAMIEFSICAIEFANLVGRFDYMKTIAELIDTTINFHEVDIITVKMGDKIIRQYDTVESAVEDSGGMKVKDYEIEYDIDEGLVYLDIIV